RLLERERPGTIDAAVRNLHVDAREPKLLAALRVENRHVRDLRHLPHELQVLEPALLGTARTEAGKPCPAELPLELLHVRLDPARSRTRFFTLKVQAGGL